VSSRIGFIGLGVMGEPICRNLAFKFGASVVAHDCESCFSVVSRLIGRKH